MGEQLMQRIEQRQKMGIETFIGADHAYRSTGPLNGFSQASVDDLLMLTARYVQLSATFKNISLKPVSQRLTG